MSNDIAKIDNLEDGEVLFFLNSKNFRFVQDSRIDYSPKIKIMIRVMDTPAEDIYHYSIEQIMPPIMHIEKMMQKQIFGIK